MSQESPDNVNPESEDEDILQEDENSEDDDITEMEEDDE